MEEGYLPLARKIQDSSIWAGSEPFDMRSAWVDLLLLAAFRTHKTWPNKTIERGTVPHSIRFLAQRWKWSKSKTHRFLRRLESGTMAELKSGHVKIVNYEVYNNLRDTSGTVRDTIVGQRWDSSGTEQKKERKKERKSKSKTLSGKAPDGMLFEDDVSPEAKLRTPAKAAIAEEIYKAYPRNAKKPKAIKEITAAIKRHPDVDILAVTKEYAASAYVVSRLGTDDAQFIPHPDQFYKHDRFLDDRAEWAAKRNGTQSRRGTGSTLTCDTEVDEAATVAAFKRGAD